MNDKIKSAQDDLAFLRTIAERGGNGGMGVAGCALYGSAGVLYGIQTLSYYLQEIGVMRMSPLASLTMAWAPTAIFLVLMTIVIVIDRKRPAVGVTSRAVNSAFAGAGIANLALVIVFASAAAHTRDFHYWLFHPAVVFVLQGAVWYVIYMLRKRLWMAAVAAGWVISGVALGMLIWRADLYLLISTLSLFLLMGVTGFGMMRQALRTPAA